jgi:hypothetical protein
MAKKKVGPDPFRRRLGSNPPSGRSNADQHFHELVGSSGFWIYLPPNTQFADYTQLKEQVETTGCTIGWALDAPVDLGRAYTALKVAPRLATLIPEDALRLAHRWAHNHDLLHSFFKPPTR